MHVKTRLDGWANSHVYKADGTEADTAIVFVHGFWGDPTKTWLRFQSLIDEPSHEAQFSAADLYFYGYSTSFECRVEPLACDLRTFVESVFPKPSFARSGEISAELKKLDLHVQGEALVVANRYRRLVLVGHSLGGILVRQMVMDVSLDFENKDGKEGDPDVAYGRLRLFAPPLSGFKPLGWRGVLSQALGGLAITRFIIESLPIYEDLRPGSRVLGTLREVTEEMARRHPAWTAARARLLNGKQDYWIDSGTYNCDNAAEFENRDHRSICKPDREYLRPLEFVADELSRLASA